MKKQKGSAFTKLLIVMVLVGGTIAGYMSLRRNMVLSTKALTPEKTAQISTKVAQEGEKYKVSINLKTATEDKNENISVVALKIKVSSKSGKNITLTGANGSPANEVSVGTDFTSDNWTVATNKVDHGSGGVEIQFMAANTHKEGYKSTDPDELLSFYVSGAVNDDDLKVELDEDSSELLSKRRPVTNIWLK